MKFSPRIILFSVIFLALVAGVTILLLFNPIPDSSTIPQGRIQFSMSPWDIPQSRRQLQLVFAARKGGESLEFYWKGKNGDGIRVVEDNQTGKLYGQHLKEGIYEYHEIGSFSLEKGVIHANFLPGSTFIYSSGGFDYGDVITVQVPIETEIAFTEPLPKRAE